MWGKHVFWAVCLIVAIAGIQQAAAATEVPVFESAKLGTPGLDHGFTLSANQWLGVRFTTTEPTQVSSIGGHLTAMRPGRLFVAVFAIDGSLPPSPPNIGDAHFVATFEAPEQSGEVRVPADFHLPAGDWAIVFGSGAAGASGHGAMPGKDLDIGSPHYFSKDGSSWTDGGFGKARFFIKGKPAEKVAPSKPRPSRSIELA